MSQSRLKQVLKRICKLQLSYSSSNTLPMQERGRLIRDDLVAEIRNRGELLRPAMNVYGEDFDISASDGIGRKTEAPWVRFYSKSMSPTPREGYYVVVHFSRDGSGLYLTLGCGSTIWKNGTLIPIQEIELQKKTQAAKNAILSRSKTLADFIDDISLGAKAPLPRQFELATVIAKRINYQDIDEADFDVDFVQSARFLADVYESQRIGFDMEQSDQVEAEIEAVINPCFVRRTGGQGFGLTAEEKKAVEIRAMQVTEQWFVQRGFDLENTSSKESYDYLAKKDGESWKVEVKGTTSFSGGSMSMSRNEVILHQTEKGKTVLSIVSNISLERDTDLHAYGGIIEVLMGWNIDDWSITPTSYRIERSIY